MNSYSSFAGSAASSSSALLPRRRGEEDREAAGKRLTDAAQLLERELDHDEKREEVLDDLTSEDTGLYRFEKNRLQHRRTVNIPPAIIEQYNHLECKSFVGLFPEIHRAFITIDNKLFLWNYFDGSDFATYDELSQIIISVALLKPKPGVFVDSIRHVLVVSTPVEILMFAVKFEDGNVLNPLQLFPTQFTVPSDNIHMTSIIGTEQGRIFLCGKDGGIYELDYWNSEESGWFSSQPSILSVVPFSNLFMTSRKKCRKVNHSQIRFRLIRSILPTFLGGLSSSHIARSGAVYNNGEEVANNIESMVYDSSRNFLYTLSNIPSRGTSLKPVIVLYDLGTDGDKMRERTRIENVLEGVKSALKNVPHDSWSDLISRPASSSSTSTLTPELTLVSIAPIPARESNNVVLMAVTSRGHRVYFDLDPDHRLRVKFVRLCPPSIQAQDENPLHGARIKTQFEPRYNPVSSPTFVHTAYYRDGVLLMADSTEKTSRDIIISIHKDFRPANASAGGISSSFQLSSLRLNEAIESFPLQVKVVDISEVNQNATLNLLSYALYARAAPAFRGRTKPPRQALYGLSELATQHLTPNRQFLVLTYNSLQTFIKLRPLDELKQCLAQRKRTNDETGLIHFLGKYGAKESCAMCLTIICASYQAALVQNSVGSEFDGNVERKTPGALLIASPNKLFKGTDVGMTSPTHGLGGISDEQLRKVATQAFFRFGDIQAELDYKSSYGSGSSRNGSTSSSPKLEGIALYMARWLRAHWEWSICILSNAVSSDDVGAAASRSTTPFLTFRFSKEFYVELLQPLVKLQRFIEANQERLVGASQQQYGASSSNSAYTASNASGGLADPGRLEEDNFDALYHLLNLTIEIFNLLILIQSYSPPSSTLFAGAANGASSSRSAGSVLLHANLSPNDLQALLDLRFVEILTSPEGYRLVREMIKALANAGAGSKASRGALNSSTSVSDDLAPARGKRTRRDEFNDLDSSDSTNALISQLHSACPTFFGKSELQYFHALDSLKLAKQCWNLPVERQQHIAKAIQTYKSDLMAPNYPLHDIALKLKGVYQYEGVVELAMLRAEVLKQGEVARPKGDALALGGGFRASQHRATDAEFIAAQRKECFQVIKDVLSSLMIGDISNANEEKKGITSATSSSSFSSLSASAAGGNKEFTIPPLSLDQLNGIRDRVFLQILSCKDAELHAEFYEWLIAHEKMTELFSIQNEELIRFLTADEKHILILKNYYLHNQLYQQASVLLDYLSRKPYDHFFHPSLNERIEFLTRAYDCASNVVQKAASNALIPSGGRFNKKNAQLELSKQEDLCEQLKVRIEIAKIQCEIYRRLQAVAEESYSNAELQRIESRANTSSTSGMSRDQFLDKRTHLERALTDLNSSLFDLQALYLVCTEFGLWECCLLIFKSSNESQRSDVICALWRNIFRSEIAACKKANQDWGENVCDKFVELASDRSTNYKEIDYMFPLEFIIRELEINNFRYRASPQEDYVSSVLLKAGISANKLLQNYSNLLHGWEDNNATNVSASSETSAVNSKGLTIQTYLYWSIWYVLRTVYEQERASASTSSFGISAASRRSLLGGSTSSSAAAASALNLCNECITNLHTLPPSDTNRRLASEYQHLYDAFKKIRA